LYFCISQKFHLTNPINIFQPITCMQEKRQNIKSTIPVKVKLADPEIIRFPIVCIGASAGGLDALEQFLDML